MCESFFFFNDTATTEIYTLSLHDALPISTLREVHRGHHDPRRDDQQPRDDRVVGQRDRPRPAHARQRHRRSEEHTSELQSRQYLVCRLLLEKKKTPDSYLHCQPNVEPSPP